MKKFIKLLSLLLCFAFILTGCSQNKNMENKTLVIGLDDNFKPMAFKDADGKLVGFDIDLANAFATKSGVTVKFQPIDWSAKELELSSKRIDVIWNGLTITDDRKKSMLFTDPYLNNRQVILVKKDSDIKTKADLEGKNVAVQKDSSGADAVKSDAIFSKLKGFNEYADYVTAFTDLEIGRDDAVVVDEIVADYFITSSNKDFITLEDNFGSEQYGIATRLDDIDNNNLINDTLNALKNDGTTAEISNKWFGNDIVIKK